MQLGIKPIVREVPAKEQVEPTKPQMPTEKPQVPVKPKEPTKPSEVPAPEKPEPFVKPEEAKPSFQPSPQLGQPSLPKTPAEERKPPTPQFAFEWEMLLGGKFALWVGATLVLLAASFGIAYSWQFLGPTGRVLIGTLAGITFLAVGEFAKGRTAKWFVEGITALGLALLYLTIWAAAMRYRILDFSIAFGAMSLVTAMGVIASVRHDALSLILFATVGGFLTPVLLRAEGGGKTLALPFFGYITVLNAGILATAAHKRWWVVNLVAFFATLLIASGWALFNYEPNLRWQTFAFATVNFLIFTGIGFAYPLRFRERSELADLTFLLMVASVYFVVGALLLWQPLTSVAMPKPLAFMRGALGVFPISLAAFWAVVGEFVRKRLPNDKALMLTTYGLAVGFLTIAIPMQFEGNPIAIAWAVEAAVLTAVSLRISPEQTPAEFLRDVAQLVWLLALAVALWLDLTKAIEWRPILNERFATFAVLIGSSAFMAREHWLRGTEVSSAMAAIIASGLVFWLLAHEILAWFEWAGWFTEFQAEAAWLTVFGIWAIVAVAFISLGLRPSAPMQAAQVLSVIALLLASFGTAILSLSVVTVDWRWMLNPRFVNAVIVLTTLIVAASISAKLTERSDWLAPSVFAFAASILGVLTLSEEIYAGFWQWRFPSAENWEVAAWLCIFGFWSIASVGIWLAGLKWRMSILRNTGLTLWLLTLLGLFPISSLPEISEWQPIFNFRAGAFIMIIAAGTVLAVGIKRRQEDLTEIEREIWQPTYLGAAVNFLALWALTQETHFWFSKNRFPSPETWGYAAQGAISVVWAIYAAIAMALGIVKRWTGARWLGLILLCAAVLKVFIFDLGFLTLPYRMLSFGVLGLILLGVAWAYSRYGELLRKWTSS